MSELKTLTWSEMVANARKEEREACAKIADSGDVDGAGANWAAACKWIAEEIRKRKP